MAENELSSKLKDFAPKKLFDWVIYGIFIIAVLKLADMYTDINEHEDNWNDFKQQHHCELKLNRNGNKEAAWLCDDGKTYYRWRQVLR